MQCERGFSVIEVLVAVGIVASIAIGGLGFTLSSRSMQVSAAAGQFDALLAAARTSASAFTDGVTIAFVSDAFGDGFVARVYGNRPATQPLVVTTLPVLAARVSVRESQTLGAPSFALTIHADGSVSGIVGDVRGAAGPETPCPPSGAYRLLFSYARAQAQRDVPCRFALATTGPPALATVTPALPLPLPTAPPCAGGACATLPSAPPSPSPASPIPVAIFFAGPSAVQQAAQPASAPQPCAGYALYANGGGTTGSNASGGWYEDDWYVATAATSAGAFVAQHARVDGSWTFDGDGFGLPNGTYLDPSQVGASYRAVGTYGASTTIAASALTIDALRSLPPSTAIGETDYLHESCYAAWQDTPGG